MVTKKIDSVMVGILLLTLKVFISISNVVHPPEFLDDILAISASACLCVNIIQQRFSLKTLTIYFGIISLSFYTSYKIHNTSIFVTVITCLGISNKSVYDVVSYIYKIESVLFIFNFILALICACFNSEYVWRNIDGTLRFTFGLSHPNVASLIVFNLILMWIWINYHKINRKKIFYISLIVAFVFVLTRSRTFLISSLALIIILAFSKYEWMISVVSKWITIVLGIITFFVGKLYLLGNSQIILLDNFFSHRIKLIAYSLTKYGVTYWGQYLNYGIVNWEASWGLNSFNFDNVYIYFISNIGICWLVIISIAFMILAQKSDAKNKIFIILWAIYGLTEVHGINCYMFFPILLISMVLGEKKEVKNDD